MEQGRILIAIVLSFAVFLLWDFFFVEKPALPPAPAPSDEERTS